MDWVVDHFRGLTVMRPWAWAIVHGHKLWENRTQRWRYRGALLIHAGKGKAYRDACGDKKYRELMPGLPQWDEHVRGAIVGAARMVDVLPVSEVDDPFAVGPWCIQLADCVAFEKPVECLGALQLWDVGKIGVDKLKAVAEQIPVGWLEASSATARV